MLLTDWILIILFLLTLLFLFFTCTGSAAQYTNSWRLMYLIPFGIVLLHGFFFGLDRCLIGLYIGSDMPPVK